MAVLTSVQSGYWTDPSTWNAGRVPAAGDQVVISSGHTVIYNVVEGSINDVELGISASSLDVDIYGTLQFDTSATLPLRLRFKGYMRIRGTGKLICGTESDPMPVKVTIMKTTAGYHMCLFENNAELSLVGVPNVPYDNTEGWYRFITTLAAPANSGATTITVTDNLNWQVGDFIILPRLPSSEVPGAVTNPHVAQITSVSGNTLTLSASLPQSYPAGAWVAKINRPITLHFVNNSAGYYIFSYVTSGNYLKITGMKWVWAYLPNTGSNYFILYASWNNISVDYLSVPTDKISVAISAAATGSINAVNYLVGNPVFVVDTIIRGGVMYGAISLTGSFPPIRIQNAHLWDFYPSGNQSNKIYIGNCVLFSFHPRASFYGVIENSICYGFGAMQNFSTPSLSRLVVKNCKFYTYSQLGYTTGMRNRFDWLSRGGLILWDFINCELNNTWSEPSAFGDDFGYDLPKVRFINKKVGDTTIHYQEFQAGGVLTSDTTSVPAGSKGVYTLKIEPKNSALPFVYDVPIPPKQIVSIWFYRNGSFPFAKAQIVEWKDTFAVDPTVVTPISSINFMDYPSDTWHKLEITNPTTEWAVLQVIVKGTSGTLWIGIEGLEMTITIQDYSPVGNVESLTLNAPVRVTEVYDMIYSDAVRQS